MFSNFVNYRLFVIKIHSERWNLFSPKTFHNVLKGFWGKQGTKSHPDMVPALTVNLNNKQPIFYKV